MDWLQRFEIGIGTVLTVLLVIANFQLVNISQQQRDISLLEYGTGAPVLDCEAELKGDKTVFTLVNAGQRGVLLESWKMNYEVGFYNGTETGWTADFERNLSKLVPGQSKEKIVFNNTLTRVGEFNAPNLSSAAVEVKSGVGLVSESLEEISVPNPTTLRCD